MRILAILIQASWQGWLNSVQYASEERRKKILEIIGFFVLIAALYLMGRTLFGAAMEQLGDAHEQTVLQAINIFMALGVFILAKDGMEGTIKQLYEADDTSLLLSSPLPPSAIFGFKLIQLIASSVLSMIIWLLPPWIAFGQLFRLPWHFYFALIPTCFSLLVIIISEMTIVMMLIVRFFSSRRMIQFLKILGTTIGVAAGFLLSMGFLALNQADQVAQFLLSRFKAPASDWYPHLWVAKLMMSWLPGSEIQPLRWAIQLVVAGVSVPALGMLLAAKIYGRSWEFTKHVETSPTRKERKQAKLSIAGRGKLRSMMAKDFLVFIRNKGRITVIVTLTLSLLMAMFMATYETRQNNAINREIDPHLLVMEILIMTYSVMITLGLTWGGFKAEGKTWWMLKSGPVSPELLFKSKFLIAAVCSVTYTNAWMCAGLILFRISAQLWLPILFTTALITAAAIAFNTAIGSLPWVAEIGRADRDPEKRPVLRIATILFTIIINMILLIGTALLLEIAVLNEITSFESQLHFSLSTEQQISIAGTLGLLIGIWGGSYLLGKQSLRRLLYK